MKRAAFALATLLASPMLSPGVAVAGQFRSEYAVTLYGLTLARSSFQSTISEEAFDIKGRLKSAGVAAIFDTTEGTVATRGTFADETPRPNAFRVDYTANGKPKLTEVSFKGGNVTRAVNKPPVNTKRKTWVQTRPGDLNGVADPLSAVLVKAGSPRAVCDRTLKLFDGAMRADLKLSLRDEARTMKLRGYKGEAVVCDARFVPLSGYRTNYQSIRYLQKSSGIRIAFAPVGSTGIYAPVEATIGTQIGTIAVRATRFEMAD